MLWIWLVLLYGVLKGAREIVKKKSLQKNTIMEVLLVYTLLSFLMVVPDVKNAMGVQPITMCFIALKSFVIFVAWMLSFRAIKQMPISLYGVLDLSRVLFSTLLGILVLGEHMGVWQILGLVLVCTGLLLCKRRKPDAEQAEKIEPKIVAIALFSCILNAVSGLLDKLLMRTVNSTQLQFWYMLFLVLFYVIYIVISKEKIRFLTALKNYWIWILSVMFMIGDRALFIANQSQDSRITVMTLLKQAGCIVTILAGKFIFKEKNIGYKLFCAAVIIVGIVVAVL